MQFCYIAVIMAEGFSLMQRTITKKSYHSLVKQQYIIKQAAVPKNSDDIKLLLIAKNPKRPNFEQKPE
jgi:hypothetical protein